MGAVQIPIGFRAVSENNSNAGRTLEGFVRVEEDAAMIEDEIGPVRNQER
jgi:hypothetical protein